MGARAHEFSCSCKQASCKLLLRTLVHVTSSPSCRGHVTRLSAIQPIDQTGTARAIKAKCQITLIPDILDHKHTDSKDERTDSIDLPINIQQLCSGSSPYFIDRQAISLDIAGCIPRCTPSFTRPHNPSEPISTRYPSHPTRWGCTSYTRNSTTSLRSCPPYRMGWQ